MTEGVAVSNDADAAAQRASEQARLRKERREAKLKAGGSARLDKITGLSGRPQAGELPEKNGIYREEAGRLTHSSPTNRL